jgi:hypothetical protein
MIETKDGFTRKVRFALYSIHDPDRLFVIYDTWQEAAKEANRHMDNSKVEFFIKEETVWTIN